MNDIFFYLFYIEKQKYFLLPIRFLRNLFLLHFAFAFALPCIESRNIHFCLLHTSFNYYTLQRINGSAENNCNFSLLRFLQNEHINCLLPSSNRSFNMFLHKIDAFNNDFQMANSAIWMIFRHNWYLSDLAGAVRWRFGYHFAQMQ